MEKTKDAASSIATQDQFRKNAFRSTMWIGVGFGAGQVVKLVSSVVLTRMIHPEVYGLMDLVTVFSVALALFSDIGLGPCVVQHPRGEDRAFLNTAWTLQALRGLVLFAISAIIAYPASLIYRRPILLFLIPAVGFGGVIDGMVSSGMFVLARHVRRGPTVAFELVASIVVFAVTLGSVYAANPAGVLQVARGTLSNLPFDESLCWAVVLGILAGRVSNLVLSYVAVPHPWPEWAWDREVLREIFGFGKWIFLTTALTFLAMYTDRMVVPRVIDFQTSGLYGRAIALLAIPLGLLIQLASSVVFPYCSRLRQGGDGVGNAASKIYLTAGVASSLLMSGLIACGPAVTAILYPPTYASVGWILQAVAVVGWVQSQSNTAGWVLLGYDCRPALTASMTAKIIGLIAFIGPSVWVADVLGWQRLTGLILGFGMAELLRYAVIVVYARRLCLRTWQYDVVLAPAFIGVALLGLAVAPWWNVHVLGGAPTTRWQWLSLFVAQGTTVAVVWGAIAGALHKLGIAKFR